MASLTLDERRAIVFGAASVYERATAFAALDLQPSGEPAAIHPDARATLQQWSRVFAPGDHDAFLRRLQWDQLDCTTVGRALSTTTLEIEPESDWTTWLDLMLEAAADLRGELESGPSADTLRFVEPGDLPFVEFAIVGVKAARAFLLRWNADAYATFTDAAQHAIERQLARELAVLGERTLYELFRRLLGASADGAEPAPQNPADSAGNERYRAFVLSMLEDGLSTFWVAYPVLARETAHVIERWVETTNELVQRLEMDRETIARELGEGVDPGFVTRLEPALSDPHNGRRRVAALTFDSGLRLVYKPRDVGLEAAFSQFLAWMNGRGAPEQRALRVIERDGYGWVEFAEHEGFLGEDEVSTYYRQAGAMAAIAYFLGAMDLHMENVAATRRGPVIVDPESLLYPGRPRVTESNPRSTAGKAASCVETGFITFAEAGADGQRYETGGLRGSGRRGSTRPRRAWTGVGTDALAFKDEHEFQAPSANRVVLRGVEQRAEDHRAEILDGFCATYRFCMATRDEISGAGGALDLFDGRRARVLFRPTNQYAVVQDVLAAPKYQANGVARSTALDVLARPFTMDHARPLAWPIAIEERRALQNLDIPHFTVAAGETVVRSGDRALGDRFFSRSGLEMARDRIRGLSETDLAIQLAWIERSLAESATSRFHAAAPRIPPATPSDAPERDSARHIAVAIWIGREFLDRAASDGDALTWVLHTPGQIVGDVEHHAIYSGTLGPALFLAALAEVTGDPSWAVAARRAARPVCAFADGLRSSESVAGQPVGVGVGLGSIVYGLRWLGALLGDGAYTERAGRLSEYLTPALIGADRDLDVVGGSAGAILALLSLQDVYGDRVVDRARACGDHLVAAQIHTHWGSNWPSSDGRLLAGFAHGAAGIAYALVRLYEATGNRRYLEAALRGHRYERAVYAPAQRNWPLVRSAGHLPGNVAVVMTAWCHGAPGVALARALVRDAVIDEDPEVPNEIDIALQTTAGLAANPGDHLCCGNIGRSDVLFTAGRRLGRQPTVDAATALAIRIEDQALSRGYFQFVSAGSEYVIFDPGFFQGLSGIGYQLLRLAAPTRLPSMLAFEARVTADVPAAARVV